MAYRKEKETNREDAIVIDGWEKGIAPDPYSGLGKTLTADLATPGEISSGYTLTLNALGAGTLNTPIHRAMKTVNGVATLYFILDSASQVWSSSTYNGTFSFLSTSNATTGATATNQGLAYWIPPSGGSGWLFKFRNGSVDYLAAGAGTWQTGWKPIYASTNHYAISAQDGAVYFCNGPGIGSILEVEGQVFDPTNAATYTFTALDSANPTTTSNALTIPSYDSAQSLAEQGTNLLIGGSLNAIYPWDRLSTSFAYPILIGDTFIDRMVTVNTNVYIFPGGTTSRGRIYVTNGSQANLYYKIPDFISGIQDPYFVWGDAMFHRNNLIFGFFMKNNSSGFVTADGTFFSTSMVWALDLENNVFRSLSRMDANSSIGRANVLMPALQTAPGMAYIVGVEDSQGATSAAIDYSGTTAGVGRFTVYTDMMPVGTLFDKRTFTQVEFKLRSPLQSGESLDILPIMDGVLLGSVGLANTVGQISAVYPVNFQGAQWLSFLVQGIGNSATSGVRLHEIRVR